MNLHLVSRWARAAVALAFGTVLLACTVGATFNANPAGAADPAFTGSVVDSNGQAQSGWAVLIDGTQSLTSASDGTFSGTVADGTHEVQISCPTLAAPEGLSCSGFWSDSFQWDSSANHTLHIVVPPLFSVPYVAYNNGQPVAGATVPDDEYYDYTLPSVAFSPLGDAQQIHFYFHFGSYRQSFTDAAGTGSFLSYEEPATFSSEQYPWMGVNNQWHSRLMLGSAVQPFQDVLSQSTYFHPGMDPLRFDFSVTGPPSIPGNVAVTPGDTQAHIEWSAPNDDGSAITGYSVSFTSNGGTTMVPATMCSGTATSCTVTGLTNGTAYQFSVTASNGEGTGSASPLSESVTPASSSPAPAPPPSGVAAGDLGVPVSSRVVAAQVTSVAVTSGGSQATLSIPAGALPDGTSVSVYPVTQSAAVSSALPPGSHYVTSFVVSWKAPDGSVPTATHPISMEVRDPSIQAGDAIYQIVGSAVTLLGTASSNGVADITFSEDPVLAVATLAAVTATTSTEPVGSALAFTGSNLVALVGIASAMVCGGIIQVRRRKGSRI